MDDGCARHASVAPATPEPDVPPALLGVSVMLMPLQEAMAQHEALPLANASCVPTLIDELLPIILRPLRRNACRKASVCKAWGAAVRWLMLDERWLMLDALRLVIASLTDARGIKAVLASRASSRQLSLVSNEVLMQRGGKLLCICGASLYHAIQYLLHKEVPESFKWLIIQSWSEQLHVELQHPVTFAIFRQMRWRKMHSARYYKCRGLDTTAASGHIFQFQGADISVDDWYRHHHQPNLPVTRPDLPCMLVGPRSNPSRACVPLELLELPLPSEHPPNPNPDQVEILTPAARPAMRALVDYVRACTPWAPE